MPSREEHSEYRYGIWHILVDTDTIRTDTTTIGRYIRYPIPVSLVP